MKELSVVDRLTFLAKEFDVFESEDIDSKIEELTSDGFTVLNSSIAILSTKINKKERVLKKISVSSKVFYDMVSADPTNNKINLQWMLNLFSHFIKENTDNSISSAIRFVDEDLPQANTYLKLFEQNKHKKKFTDLCKSNYGLLGIQDYTNINQYKSLGQLFDSVDPFILKNPSTLEKTLNKFVDAGQADIPVKDRKFTLYIPKTRDASVVFDKFANWCTAKEGNGKFRDYTKDYKKPNGKDSNIYIIINNDFFNGSSNDIFQIHFETNQIKNKTNSENVSIFENVLNESEALSNFFHKELLEMAKTHKKGIENNIYLDYLIKFGFTESLFDLIDAETQTIKFMTREIPKLPDISRFKILDQLIITNANMVELHPSIGKLSNLQMISFTGNRLKIIPKEISYLKKLEFFNITGNPISEIPNDIKYLDKTNGGSLYRLAVKKEDIGEDNYNKLKILLPTTQLF